MERERPNVSVEHSRCPYCHDAVRPGQEKEGCRECMAWHHAECWTEYGSCAACGARPRHPSGALARASDRKLVVPEGQKLCSEEGCDRRAEKSKDSTHSEPYCLEHLIPANRKLAKESVLIIMPLFLGIPAALLLTGTIEPNTWAGWIGIAVGLLGLIAPIMAIDLTRQATRWESELRDRELKSKRPERQPPAKGEDA